MINFKYVKWKNFLSTGNEFTKIQLDKTPSTLIVGSNGAGKSTLLDALSYSLFGKAHRDIKKDQLVNSINKKKKKKKTNKKKQTKKKKKKKKKQGKEERSRKNKKKKKTKVEKKKTHNT